MSIYNVENNKSANMLTFEMPSRFCWEHCYIGPFFSKLVFFSEEFLGSPSPICSWNARKDCKTSNSSRFKSFSQWNYVLLVGILGLKQLF